MGHDSTKMLHSREFEMIKLIEIIELNCGK